MKQQPATLLDIIARLPAAAVIGALVGELMVNPLASALTGLVENPAMAAVMGLPAMVGAAMAGLTILVAPWRTPKS